MSKRKKTIALAAAAVFAVSTGVLAYSSATHPPTKSAIKPQENKVDNKTQPEHTESVSRAPEVQNTGTVAGNDQTAVQTPQNTSTEQETTSQVPSIDELKAQYGWNVMSSGAIDTYQKQYPQYFTEQYRQAAFKYMFDVSQQYALKTGADVNAPSSKCYGWYRLYQQSGDWVAIGQTVGLDWNSYVN